MKPRSIVDFGGSSGWAYEYLRNSVRELSIFSYAIVEIESVVEHMGAAKLHKPPVVYKKAAEPLERCDLLYSNSVLQYCESNAQLLDLVDRTRPDYVLLEDLVALGESDFFTLQTYFDTTIAYRFLGFRRLVNDLSSRGYAEILRCPYGAGGIGAGRFEMDNFPEDKRLRHSLSIVFRRSGNA